MKKMHIVLDEFEQDIEDNIEHFVPLSADEKRQMDDLAASAKKQKNISIRISQSDLNGIKRRSAEEGIPYQTLITSVLHRYIAGGLVDERAIRKTVELIGGRSV